MRAPQDVAVLIPCYNEELTVAKVVGDFRQALPGARIYVYNNNSTDRTHEVAAQAGAEVVDSPRRGKGNVVRHMFDSIDAQVYVLVDGDDTYPADMAPALIGLYDRTQADMVVGTRMHQFDRKSFRRFHHVGNGLITFLIRVLFRVDVTDVLSGYRVFSRDFVKTVPLASGGFDLETELTLQAVGKKFLIREMPVKYGERPEGSFSKLNTWSDGWIVFKAILLIFRDYKPLVFFMALGSFFFLLSIISGWAPILDYYEDAYVYHVPRAILAAALAILSCLSVFVGLILETVRRYYDESFLLWRRLLRDR